MSISPRLVHIHEKVALSILMHFLVVVVSLNSINLEKKISLQHKLHEQQTPLRAALKTIQV